MEQTMLTVLFIFALLMLGVQVFVILALMKLFDISANIDRITALLAAIANKMEVSADDVKKVWGADGKELKEKGES